MLCTGGKTKPKRCPLSGCYARRAASAHHKQLHPRKGTRSIDRVHLSHNVVVERSHVHRALQDANERKRPVPAEERHRGCSGWVAQR